MTFLHYVVAVLRIRISSESGSMVLMTKHRKKYSRKQFLSVFSQKIAINLSHPP
jgi:hypothetical protein